MKSFATLLVAFLAGSSILSCERAEQEGAAVETADAANLEAALDSLNDRFEQSLIAGDSVALGDFYAEDAVALPPNSPRAEGKDAIRSFWAGVIASTPVTSVSLDADKVVVAESGELAYEVGRYSLAGTTPDGQTWQDEGKYLVAWRNVGGEWKLVADMWSSDQASPGEAPADTSAPQDTAAQGGGTT